MNIDDLKAQVSNYLDENMGLDEYRLDVGIILDYLHEKGLLMVWNYDMSAAPKNDYAKVDILTKRGLRFADSLLIKSKWVNSFCGVEQLPIEDFGHEIVAWMFVPPIPKGDA